MTLDQVIEAQKLKLSGVSWTEIGRRLGVHRSTVQRKVEGNGVKPRAERPGVEVRGDEATVVSAVGTSLSTPEEALRARGLDPEEWEVKSMVVNEWEALAAEGETQTLRQMKLLLSKRTPVSFLFPAVDVRQRAKPKPRKAKGDEQTIVLLPDPHCPYQDTELDKRVEEFLHVVQPDRIVFLGDVCDFSSISKHRDNPAWFATANENVQSGFEWAAGKRDAAPDAEIEWVEGNHDFRLRGELLARAERMYGIKPAQIPGEGEEYDALSLRRLLHLDRLQIQFVGPPLDGDNYFHAGVDLGPDLCARHGWLTGANSARATMERLGMSVVFGHTHHQRMHYQTVYRGSKPVGKRVGVESGTLARIEGGLGYAANPDWQQGFTTATVWPDGSNSIDLARYEFGSLIWRGRRF